MASERHEEKLARWARGSEPAARAVAAATVVLLRDGERGLETLMLRRNSKLAFVGGMWVFPGGRVDDEDARGLDPADELGVARRAAVREAAEESGLSVDPEGLAPYSHWTPPPITPRRFLTWFFLAKAPDGPVQIDRGEIHDHAWMQPSEALRRRDAQEIELAPPTFVTLHELCAFASADLALAAVRQRLPRRYETRIALTQEGPVALWQGDAGWTDGDPERPGARHRLRMLDAGWVLERVALED
jgi:8-oxo-dGTP pyrophosphatase MutT (NUDIX family)